MVRFLRAEEYPRTRALSFACFGDDAFDEVYYVTRGDIYKNRIAVKEQDGKIVAMLQLAPRKAWYGEKAIPVDYIMYVATDPAYRHRGYMDELLRFACDTMRQEGKEWTFLVAVNKEIYRHFGFVYDWRFHPEEADLLYADEGLTECSAKLLCADAFHVPDYLTM